MNTPDHMLNSHGHGLGHAWSDRTGPNSGALGEILPGIVWDLDRRLGRVELDDAQFDLFVTAKEALVTAGAALDEYNDGEDYTEAARDAVQAFLDSIPDVPARVPARRTIKSQLAFLDGVIDSFDHLSPAAAK